MRYEKGRKDASRRRIVEVAAERFRHDGIAATGLAGIMSEAGLTNGAFYPHFQSKAELVRETVTAALEAQSSQLRDILAAGGLENALTAYLSAEHRDNPATGCASAALLPELARQPPETRRLYAERLLTMLRQVSAALPPQTRDPEGVMLGVFATLIGALQLARAVDGTDLSDRILAAGADAARALIRPRPDEGAS
ncbi:MAG TPA: TetR/AcrR family transcriptional regulator [Inquilinus sp.]|uniref:TetR/AcrR family transcriptional regulator n=1 Tax=Inquilinus sp. TaxID=1932117 RepID=UPI002FB46AAF